MGISSVSWVWEGEAKTEEGGEINEREGKCAVRIPDLDAMKTNAPSVCFSTFSQHGTRQAPACPL